LYNSYISLEVFLKTNFPQDFLGLFDPPDIFVIGQKRRLEPNPHRILGFAGGNESGAQRQNIGIIVLS